MKTKMTLFQALTRANDLMDVLAPACERILIAGSIRRQKAEIGDIEIVLIPKLTPIPDLLGDPMGYNSQVDDYLASASLPIIKNGEKYKQIIWQEMSADLFICSPETWGCIATIRTGSADFTHWLVTPKMQGGAKPGHMSFKDGRLYAHKALMPTPEEADVFRMLGLDWIAPEERIEGRWKR